jgi:chromosome segregation ATPase
LRIGKRSKATSIVFDQDDLTEFLAEGKITGRSRGHAFMFSCPTTSMGVSTDAFELLNKEVKDLNSKIESYKTTVAAQAKMTDELGAENNELELKITKLKKIAQKYKKQAEDQDKSTIPIDEHQDLMSSKIQEYEEKIGDLERDQKEAYEKLEDEIDSLRSGVSDLNGQVGNLETERDQLRNDLADCEN